MSTLTLLLAVYALAAAGTGAIMLSAAPAIESADTASPGVVLFRVVTLSLLWPLTMAVFGLAALSPMFAHWIANGVDER